LCTVVSTVYVPLIPIRLSMFAVTRGSASWHDILPWDLKENLKCHLSVIVNVTAIIFFERSHVSDGRLMILEN
jgi:hypothetical protein